MDKTNIFVPLFFGTAGIALNVLLVVMPPSKENDKVFTLVSDTSKTLLTGAIAFWIPSIKQNP